jgi:hypothetical protein
VVTVYTDIDGNGLVDEGDASVPAEDASGDPGGLMAKVGDAETGATHLMLVLSTANFPDSSGCFIVEVTVSRNGSPSSERVLLQRK